jgi:hypothetical protein
VSQSDSIAIPIKAGGRIEADLWVPNLATGLVIFAHGTGSSRFSSRNRAVAHTFQERSLGPPSSTLEQVEQLAGDWFVRYLHPA